MLRAIKIRLYPNKEQATMFNKLLGCYRVVYNQCLSRKIESYKNDGKSENLSTLGQFVHHELLKDEKFIWLREQNTKVLKQAVKDMLTAYKNFFEQHFGFPKFKSKHHSRNAYTTNLVNGNIRLFENGIRLPKAGVVKAKIHRQIPEGFRMIPWPWQGRLLRQTESSLRLLSGT